jgi:hypothetical protein
MMKKIITNLLILAVALLLVTSCDDTYPIIYDDSVIVVGMSSASLSVNENASGSFNIYLGGVSGTEATDVTLAVSVDGISKPAVEGTDFTLSSKSVNVPVGVATVTVNPIDNSVFAGNKQFKVTITGNSKDYPLAVQKSILVTLVDDEHPLKNWIGTYTVAAASYGDPGNWDEEWTVVTSPVAGDVTKLALLGISDGTKPAIATFNTTAMTIEIETPQDLGQIYGYADPYWGEIYYGTDLLFALVGGNWADPSDGILGANSGIKLTGTIEADGTIRIDKIAPVLRYSTTDYVVWDMFNTTWTK